MKITSRIATSGAAGVSRFPTPSASIDDCMGEDGHLDELKMRRALNVEQITIGSNDGKPVLVFAMEYLHQLRSVVEYMTAALNKDGEVNASVSPVDEHTKKQNIHLRSDSAADRRCDRNMRKGRYAFSTTVLTSCRDGIHAKLSYANPRGVVGAAERLAHDYTLMCAQILLYLKANITSCGVVLIEGENCAGIFDEALRENELANERERIEELSAKRTACPNRVNCYCSPSNPSCPCYCNGRCNDPKDKQP